VALTEAQDVLVLRALGLGDLLAGVPALRALRRALPSSRFTLAVPDTLAPLVDLAGLGMEVRDTRGLDAPLEVRADLAVNLHGRGPQSHRLLGPVAPHLIGFAQETLGFAGPPWRADEHERSRWCRLVSASLGVVADPDDLRIHPPPFAPGLPRGAVVVHPGAASAARRWPAARFAEVVAHLTARGLPVVVTGSADELPLARRVAAGRAEVLAGATSVTDLAGLVSRARVVLCGDTGIAHLAVAYGTASVQLFGPTPPSHWGPPPGGPHTVIWHGRTRGDPHAADTDPALAGIGVDEVLSGLDARLHAPTRSS